MFFKKLCKKIERYNFDLTKMPTSYPSSFSSLTPAGAWALVVHPGVLLTSTNMAAMVKMVKGCRVLERVPFLVSWFETSIVRITEFKI